VLLYDFHKRNDLPLFTDALRLFIKEVSTSAPDVPMYYYHIPAMTGVDCKCSPITGSQNTTNFRKFFRIAQY